MNEFEQWLLDTSFAYHKMGGGTLAGVVLNRGAYQLVTEELRRAHPGLLSAQGRRGEIQLECGSQDVTLFSLDRIAKLKADQERLVAGREAIFKLRKELEL